MVEFDDFLIRFLTLLVAGPSYTVRLWYHAFRQIWFSVHVL